MKVYIAAKFSARHRLRVIKHLLQSRGIVVLSDWLDNNPLDDQLHGDYDSIADNLETSREIAVRDIEQVSECDVFVIDTQDASPTGGRECELGAALAVAMLAHDKLPTIYRVGPIRNVFHALCLEVANWESMIQLLEVQNAKRS